MGAQLREIQFEGWGNLGGEDPAVARLSVWSGGRREVSFDVVIPSESINAGGPVLGSTGPPSRWLRAAVVWAAEEFAAYRLNRYGQYADDLETADEIDWLGQLTVGGHGVSSVAERPDLAPSVRP